MKNDSFVVVYCVKLPKSHILMFFKRALTMLALGNQTGADTAAIGLRFGEGAGVQTYHPGRPSPSPAAGWPNPRLPPGSSPSQDSGWPRSGCGELSST